MTLTLSCLYPLWFCSIHERNSGPLNWCRAGKLPVTRGGWCREPQPRSTAGAQAPIRVTVCASTSLETPSLRAYLSSGQKPWMNKSAHQTLEDLPLAFLKGVCNWILVGRAEPEPARVMLTTCEENQWLCGLIGVRLVLCRGVTGSNKGRCWGIPSSFRSSFFWGSVISLSIDGLSPFSL